MSRATPSTATTASRCAQKWRRRPSAATSISAISVRKQICSRNWRNCSATTASPGPELPGTMSTIMKRPSSKARSEEHTSELQSHPTRRSSDLVEGDAFHRYDRFEMRTKMAEEAERGNKHFSHFSPETNLFEELEKLFRDYGESGTGTTRHYVHDHEEAKL